MKHYIQNHKVSLLCSVVVLTFQALFSQPAFAGRPEAVRMWIPVAGFYAQDVAAKLAVEVLNQAGFPATDFQAAFKATRLSDGKVKFQYTTQKFTFPANTKQWVSTTPGAWTPTEPGMYKIEATISSPDDQTPNDNYVSANVEVKPAGGLSYGEARNLLLNRLTLHYPYLDLTNVWLRNTPLQPGDHVESHDAAEVSVDISEETWFAFADWNTGGMWMHPTGYFFISNEDSSVTYRSANWWPLINGTVYPSDEDSSRQKDLVYGTPRAPSHVPDSSLHSVAQGAHKDSVCALIVTGPAKSKAQREAHEFDIGTIKGNLMREAYGPGLDESNIRVLDEASKAEVLGVLDSMKNKYKTIYFYYGGHGSRYSMATDDPDSVFFFYSDLARSLSETNADSLNVLIDACHSGQAVEDFRNRDYLFKNQNVTLLTSCHADTTSWYRFSILPSGDTMRTSEFTWAFALCFGQPAADKNGDGQTSFIETMAWIYRQNPELDIGGYMNERMDPVVWVHTAVPAVSTGSSAPEIGVDIQPDTGKSDGGEYRLTFTSATDPGTYIDPKILDVYTDYTWEIEPDGVDSSGTVTLKLDYSLWTYDLKLAPRLGLVTRDSSTDEWDVYRPVIVDTSKKEAKALDVDDFSEWALASIANSAPTFASADIATDEDMPSSPVAPDVDDPDAGDMHIIAILSQPQNGTASVNANRLVYTPDKDYYGSDSFTFSAQDPEGASATGSATVTVRPVNDPPVAVSETTTTPVNTPATIDVLQNDSDVDSPVLTLQSAGTPSNGTAAVQGGGEILYTPAPDFTGQDSFTYTVADDSGATASATVTITVTGGENNPPIAVNDSVVTNEDMPAAVSVLDNDSDPDGDGLVLLSIEAPAHGGAIMIPDNVVQYTPDENYYGRDTLVYRIRDTYGAEAEAVIVITVLPVDDPPGAFTRTSPPDGSMQAAPAVEFAWTEAAEPDGEAVTYTLAVSAPSGDTAVMTAAALVTLDFGAWNLPAGQHTVTWSVEATDGNTTVHAENGEGTFTLDVTTGVGAVRAFPEGIALYQNYPNPFSARAQTTRIRYHIGAGGHVTLTVYDVFGRRVAVLVDGYRGAGFHSFAFNAAGLPPGRYFYRLVSQGRTAVGKMTVVE